MTLWPSWYNPFYRARVADIVKLAASMAAIDDRIILGDSRLQEVSRARQACYLVASEHGHHFADIGRRMSRDHSSVIYGVRVAKEYAQRDPIYAEFINELRALSKSVRPIYAKKKQPVYSPVAFDPPRLVCAPRDAGKPRPSYPQRRPQQMTEDDWTDIQDEQHRRAMVDGSEALLAALTA